MHKLPNIIVMMSTYNGEKYLRTQIDSILKQNEVNITLLVRDDGSNDKTVEILQEYALKKQLSWYTGKNLGPAKSFMNLLEKAADLSKSSDKPFYYAFSDQDDYWSPNKLITAIKKIQDSQKPALYFSQKRIVDANLKEIEKRRSPNYTISFETAMMRNVATGCTMVFNQSLCEKIMLYKPSYLVMHDSWIYRICLALDGIVIYDKTPHISYRQHGENVIGANNSFLSRMKHRFDIFLHPDHSREKTAKEILEGYRSMLPENHIKELNDLKNYRKSFSSKLRLLRNPNFKTEKFENNFVFKCALILNRV